MTFHRKFVENVLDSDVDLVTSVGSMEDVSAVGCQCMHHPEYIEPLLEEQGKNHGAQITRVRDSSNHKTEIGFHRCKRYKQIVCPRFGTTESPLPVNCGHWMAGTRKCHCRQRVDLNNTPIPRKYK